MDIMTISFIDSDVFPNTVRYCCASMYDAMTDGSSIWVEPDATTTAEARLKFSEKHGYNIKWCPFCGELVNINGKFMAKEKI